MVKENKSPVESAGYLVRIKRYYSSNTKQILEVVLYILSGLLTLGNTMIRHFQLAWWWHVIFSVIMLSVGVWLGIKKHRIDRDDKVRIVELERLSKNANYLVTLSEHQYALAGMVGKDNPSEACYQFDLNIQRAFYDMARIVSAIDGESISILYYIYDISANKIRRPEPEHVNRYAFLPSEMVRFQEITEEIEQKYYMKCIRDSTRQRIFPLPDNSSIRENLCLDGENEHLINMYSQYVAIRFFVPGFVLLVEIIAYDGKKLGENLGEFASRAILPFENYCRIIASKYRIIYNVDKEVPK